MNRTIRKTAMILAHIGLLLSILFLGFFIICSLRAQKAGETASDQKDLYLSQAMHERDFSVYTVGKALSDESNPARENLYIVADLVVPLLCLTSGILLQLAIVKPRRRQTKSQSSQHPQHRR